MNDLHSHNIIDYFLGKEWSKRKINRREFDEIFNIEGIALSWFYRRLLVLHSIPKKFNVNSMLQKIHSNKKLPPGEKIKLSFLIFFYKKSLMINEEIKIRLAKVKNKPPTKEEKKEQALFLIPSNHFNHKNNSVFRVNKVIEELRNRNIGTIQLIFDPLSRSSYKKIFNTQSTIYNYIDKEIIVKARKKANQLAKEWTTISEKEKLALFSDKEISLWPYLKYPLNFFFSKEFLFYLCLYYETIHKIVKKEQVKSIILTSQNSIFEKALLAVAKSHQIKTILIQHGLGEGAVNPDVFENTTIAVFGGMSKERLLKVGVSEEKISVVGPIIFDEIIKHKKIKSTEKEEKNTKKEGKKILIITEPFVEGKAVEKIKYFNYIKKILQEINKIDKITVTIKLHPSEKFIDNYKKIVKELGYNNIQVTQEIGSNYLYKLISDSDLVIEFGSTVAIEAMILKKPVITTNFCPIAGGIYDLIQQSKGTYKVDHQDDLAKKIMEVFNNDFLQEQRKKTIKYMCRKVDGKSSLRIAEIIAKNFEK